MPIEVELVKEQNFKERIEIEKNGKIKRLIWKLSHDNGSLQATYGKSSGLQELLKKNDLFKPDLEKKLRKNLKLVKHGRVWYDRDRGCLVNPTVASFFQYYQQKVPVLGPKGPRRFPNGYFWDSDSALVAPFRESILLSQGQAWTPCMYRKTEYNPLSQLHSNQATAASKKGGQIIGEALKIHFRDKAIIDEVEIKRTDYDYTNLCFR